MKKQDKKQARKQMRRICNIACIWFAKPNIFTTWPFRIKKFEVPVPHSFLFIYLTVPQP